MKKASLLCVWLVLGLTAWAQDTPKVEIPLGFSFVNVHPNLEDISSFNIYGGGGQVDFNFGNVFGIKADFMGYNLGGGINSQLRSAGLPAAVSGNLFTYMFGPQIKKHTGVFQPFAEALFGGAHTNAYASVLTEEGRIVSGSGNNNGFSMALGLGLDLQLSKHFALRPVEADYLLTRFSANHVANYTANQNNFRYFGGIEFLFGGAPPVPVSATCSASPSEVWSGDPVSVTITGANFNPKHTLTYAWTGNSGKLSNANAQTASVDTTGLTPGSYSARARSAIPRRRKTTRRPARQPSPSSSPRLRSSVARPVPQPSPLASRPPSP